MQSTSLFLKKFQKLWPTPSGRVDGRGRTDGRMTSGRMDEWTSEWTNRRTDGRTGGRTDGQSDGQSDGRVGTVR